MLDFGWSELLIIAIVLIVIVGPKDLPRMLRSFANMTKKMRGMAGDFRRQFDDALSEAELSELRDTLNEAKNLNPTNAIKEALNPLKEAGNSIKRDIDGAGKSIATSATGASAAGIASQSDDVTLPESPVQLTDSPDFDALSEAERRQKMVAEANASAEKAQFWGSEDQTSQPQSHGSQSSPSAEVVSKPLDTASKPRATNKKPTSKIASSRKTSAKNPARPKTATRSATTKQASAKKSATNKPAVKKSAAKKSRAPKGDAT